MILAFDVQEWYWSLMSLHLFQPIQYIESLWSVKGKLPRRVNHGLDADLAAIMVGSEAPELFFPESSFQKLFWEEQKNAASCKDPR